MKKRSLRDINNDMRQMIDLKKFLKMMKLRTRSDHEVLMIDHIILVLEEKIESLFDEAN